MELTEIWIYPWNYFDLYIVFIPFSLMIFSYLAFKLIKKLKKKNGDIEK